MSKTKPIHEYGDLSKPIATLIKKQRMLPNGCIVYTGKSRAKKYGNINWNCSETKKIKSIRAHRLAFVLKHQRDIGEGLLIRHMCHNPLCVNPDHLLEGTDKDNALDMVNAGRSLDQKGSKNHNSKLTELQRSEIKARRAAGATYKAIGLDYGIHLSTVAKICST